MIWHSASTEDIVNELGTDLKRGLTSERAEQLLALHGKNQLKDKHNGGVMKKFGDQLKNFTSILLIAAMLISLLIKILDPEHNDIADYVIEPAVIIFIILINAIIGAIGERRSEKALESLRNLTALNARVIRDGVLNRVDAADLVPGDLIYIKSGDFIPADARIIEANLLRCDESALTGENVPVEKDADAVPSDIDVIKDRKNMLYSGTAAVNGSCIAVVTETGMNTEIGKLAQLIDEHKDPLTPLQKKLTLMERQILTVGGIIAALILIIGLIVSKDKTQVFMTCISLLAAIIPESLAAIVTITLALGTTRMIKHKAIVRSISTMESIGSTSVICADKTGTLTQNKMTLVSAFTDNGFVKSFSDLDANAITLLRFSAICCRDESNKQGENGDPTEQALIAGAIKYTGIDKDGLENLYPRLAEVPFDGERRTMTTVNMISGKPVAIVKGAPEFLFDRCIDLNREAAEKANEMMSSRALRVLALCYKPLSAIPTDPSPDELEHNLTFVGLVGLIDTLNDDAVTSVAECKEAGIIPIMITGDHISAASAIAKELGILDKNTIAVTGEELAAMSDDEFALKLPNIRVYARVTSEDKLRIIKAWQDRGEVVAITGDSLSDTPALKQADIGCSLGKKAADVAKGSSDVIITDNAFHTLVSAIKEGRSIYANIQKMLQYLIAAGIAEILLLLLSLIIWGNIPIVATQLLWINLIVNSLLAFSLGAEPVGKDLMKRPPINKKALIIDKRIIGNIAVTAVTAAAVALIAYGLGVAYSSEVASTVAFIVLTFALVISSFTARSNHSIIKVGIAKNIGILLSMLLSIAFTLLLLYTPVGKYFSLSYIPSALWGKVVLLSIIPLAVSEVFKVITHFVSSNKD